MSGDSSALSVPTRDAQAAWKQTSPDDRRKALRLAKHGERHPDRAVAEAAFAWSHRASLNTWMNTRPGWLLPDLGVLLLVVALVAKLPLFFTIGAVLVIVCGLLGWNSTASARALRRVYSAPADH